MDKNELKKLEDQLQIKLKEVGDLNKLQLQNFRKILDENVKDVINIYSNDIRNISIISGTVAPFSLTLLTIDKLNTNIPLLLVGFFCLISNIVFAQFSIYKQSKDQDKEILETEMKWIFAQMDQWIIENTDNDSSERVIKNFDCSKKLMEINNSLGSGLMNINLQKVRANLRKNNTISCIFFAVGALIIALSVIISPLNILFKFIFNNLHI